MGDTTAYPGTVALANAIARAEGGLTPGTAPYRTNNPCDVFVGGSTAGYSSLSDGWDACYSQINLMLSGGSAYYQPDMTLSQVGSIYAPSSAPGNIPNAWAANVAAALGLSPSTTLAQASAAAAGSIPTPDPSDSASGYNLDSSLSFLPSAISSIDPLVLAGLALLGVGLIAYLA
jgi:hypothetical protein